MDCQLEVGKNSIILLAVFLVCYVHCSSKCSTPSVSWNNKKKAVETISHKFTTKKTNFHFKVKTTNKFYVFLLFCGVVSDIADK